MDFAVHFTHRFWSVRGATGSVGSAVESTLASTGRALRWNAAVLAASFFVLGLSGVRANHALGVLLGLAILASYVTTIGLLPWLLTRADPRS